MMYKNILMLLILCSMSIPSLADETSVTLDKIVVESENSEKQDYEPHLQLQIKNSQLRLENAATLVGRTSGIHIRRTGGADSTTQLSIRGSSSSQIIFVLDGIPLSTAGGQGIGLENISAESLSHIDIFKNNTPPELGSSAIGGVISLTSKIPEYGFHQSLSFGGGSFSTITARSESSYRTENFSLQLGLDYDRTEGNFSFVDNNGTPFNVSDDVRVQRRNNEHQTVHPSLLLRHKLDSHSELSLVLHYFRIDQGVPGFQNFQSLGAGKEIDEFLGRVHFSRSGLFNDTATVSHSHFTRFINSRFYDPNGEIGLGSAQDNDDKTFVFGDRFDFSWKALSWLSLRAGAEYQFERFVPRDNLGALPQGSPSLRHLLTFNIDPQIDLGKNLQILPEMRTLISLYDINNDDPSLQTFGTFFSQRTEMQPVGRLQIVWKPYSFFSFYGAAGRAARLPQFSELFGDQGTTLGNAQLVSEKSISYEFSARFEKTRFLFFDSFQASAGFFVTHFDDLIQFELLNGVARASNIGAARVRGFESHLHLSFLKYANASFAYTFQQAIDQAVNRGRGLVGRPQHEFHALGSVIFPKWESSVNFNFIDEMPLDGLNTQIVRHRLLIDVAASWNFWRNFRLGVEARNLTDCQLVDAVGFPLPGRSFYGKLQTRF